MNGTLTDDEALRVTEHLLTKAVEELVSHYRARLGPSTAPDDQIGFSYKSTNFTIGDLKKLHHDEKFSNFLILAAMQLASTDLIEVGPSITVGASRGKVRTSYFKRWLTTIEVTRAMRGDKTGLHLCPIFHNGHFSLLESDNSSCGPLVVWMAMRRMRRLEIGGWDEPVMPTRVRLDILQLFDQCKDVANIDFPQGVSLPSRVQSPGTFEVLEKTTNSVAANITSLSKRKRKPGDDEKGTRPSRRRVGR
ncbi:hypothetical protein ANO11243_091080 [Dothideomycetidae sp. 11243]|nr:hypothetical protein ANO11243_091080 [fungal sp. No.11243]